MTIPSGRGTWTVDAAATPPDPARPLRRHAAGHGATARTDGKETSRDPHSSQQHRPHPRHPRRIVAPHPRTDRRQRGQGNRRHHPRVPGPAGNLGGGRRPAPEGPGHRHPQRRRIRPHHVQLGRLRRLVELLLLPPRRPGTDSGGPLGRRRGAPLLARPHRPDLVPGPPRPAEVQRRLQRPLLRNPGPPQGRHAAEDRRAADLHRAGPGGLGHHQPQDRPGRGRPHRGLRRLPLPRVLRPRRQRVLPAATRNCSTPAPTRCARNTRPSSTPA